MFVVCSSDTNTTNSLSSPSTHLVGVDLGGEDERGGGVRGGSATSNERGRRGGRDEGRGSADEEFLCLLFSALILFSFSARIKNIIRLKK